MKGAGAGRRDKGAVRAGAGRRGRGERGAVTGHREGRCRCGRQDRPGTEAGGAGGVAGRIVREVRAARPAGTHLRIRRARSVEHGSPLDTPPAPPPPGTSRSRPWAGDRPTGKAGRRLRQVRGREQARQGQGAVRAGADGGRRARVVPVGGCAPGRGEARAARSGNLRHASYGSVAPAGRDRLRAGGPFPSGRRSRKAAAGGRQRAAGSEPVAAGPAWAGAERAGAEQGGPGRARSGAERAGPARAERGGVRAGGWVSPGWHGGSASGYGGPGSTRGHRARDGGRRQAAGAGRQAKGRGLSAVGCRATRVRAAAGWPGQVEGMLRGWLPGRRRRAGSAGAAGAGVVPLPVRPGGSSGRTGRESMAAAVSVAVRVVRVCGVCPGVTSRCVRLPPR